LEGAGVARSGSFSNLQHALAAACGTACRFSRLCPSSLQNRMLGRTVQRWPLHCLPVSWITAHHRAHAAALDARKLQLPQYLVKAFVFRARTCWQRAQLALDHLSTALKFWFSDQIWSHVTLTAAAVK